jgi:PAS domain S-box-containing protein
VVYWNCGPEAVFGYASTEAIGCLLNEIIVLPDRLDEEGKILRETLEIGSATFESIRRRKDLSLVYVDVSNKVLRDSQGQVQFILSSQKDVTNLKARVSRIFRRNSCSSASPDGGTMISRRKRPMVSPAS